MTYVKSYRELEVFKFARELARDIYEISKQFPKEELYSLTSQIRKSSRSVGAQIAEAWAKRRYEKHFISKLTDADGEQQETQYWVWVAADCGYLADEIRSDLIERYESVGRMLNSMMYKSSQFCF